MNQAATSVMEEEKNPLKNATSEFLAHLEALPSNEEKLREGINFMRDALAQKGNPNFKGFWEVRKRCLPLFKETLPGSTRTELWSEYIELTREGRRLKNLMDEETAFAVEQIDLAISAIEEEVRSLTETPDLVLEKAACIEFPEEPQSLEGRYPYYATLQKKLSLLNVFASRVNSLRKELIKTEMRIRQKNQFFQRLSTLGDLIFPIRKELIREISEAFVKDVENFIEEHFSEKTFDEEKIRRHVFFFREEIKTLQAVAKILTLNTHAFSTTREQLSHCWDQLKGMEKELKKEFAQQRQVSSENAEQVREKIRAFSASYATGELSVEEGFNELDSISRWMRDLELTRYDVRALKDELNQASEPLEAKLAEKENVKRQQEAEFEKARQDKFDALKEVVSNFKLQVEELKQKALTGGELEALSGELDESRKTLATLSISKMERQQMEKTLKMVRDQLAERQEQALLALSDDDRAAIDNLKSVLEQRKSRRNEIKTQIEEYRKIIGGSGLDFEKAIRYNELIASEKERLAKADEGITEIEKKIRELKKKV